jgi:hypothetical protein
MTNSTLRLQTQIGVYRKLIQKEQRNHANLLRAAAEHRDPEERARLLCVAYELIQVIDRYWQELDALRGRA